MITTDVDAKEITVTGARSVFTHAISEDGDIESLLKFLLAEIMARNGVRLIVCVGRNSKLPNVAISEEDI